MFHMNCRYFSICIIYFDIFLFNDFHLFLSRLNKVLRFRNECKIEKKCWIFSAFELVWFNCAQRSLMRHWRYSRFVTLIWSSNSSWRYDWQLLVFFDSQDVETHLKDHTWCLYVYSARYLSSTARKKWIYLHVNWITRREILLKVFWRACRAVMVRISSTSEDACIFSTHRIRSSTMWLLVPSKEVWLLRKHLWVSSNSERKLFGLISMWARTHSMCDKVSWGFSLQRKPSLSESLPQTTWP